MTTYSDSDEITGNDFIDAVDETEEEDVTEDELEGELQDKDTDPEIGFDDSDITKK
jgi:hypothetical protein